jgi:hypothetical protein
MSSVEAGSKEKGSLHQGAPLKRNLIIGPV